MFSEEELKHAEIVIIKKYIEFLQERHDKETQEEEAAERHYGAFGGILDLIQIGRSDVMLSYPTEVKLDILGFLRRNIEIPRSIKKSSLPNVIIDSMMGYLDFNDPHSYETELRRLMIKEKMIKPLYRPPHLSRFRSGGSEQKSPIQNLKNQRNHQTQRNRQTQHKKKSRKQQREKRQGNSKSYLKDLISECNLKQEKFNWQDIKNRVGQMSNHRSRVLSCFGLFFIPIAGEKDFWVYFQLESDEKTWGITGGKLENRREPNEEKHWDCLVRETQEETGVSIKQKYTQRIHKSRQGMKFYYLLFKEKIFPENHKCNEITDSCYIKLSELLHLVRNRKRFRDHKIRPIVRFALASLI